jgi:hypothetical protein
MGRRRRNIVQIGAFAGVLSLIGTSTAYIAPVPAGASATTKPAVTHAATKAKTAAPPAIPTSKPGTLANAPAATKALAAASSAGLKTAPAAAPYEPPASTTPAPAPASSAAVHPAARTLLQPAITDPTCTDDWNGSTGNWTTAASWSTGVVPTSSDVACLPATSNVTLDAPEAIGALINQGGTLLISPNTSLSTSGIIDNQSGSTLTVRGQDACSGNDPATLTAGTGLGNEGTLNLDRAGTCNGGQSTVTVSSGTLTNTGTIAVTADVGSATAPHAITGAVQNAGTVNVTGGQLSVTTAASTWTDAGTITTGAGTTVGFGAGTSLTFTSGTLTNAGTFTTAGTDTQGNGALAAPQGSTLAASSIQVTAGTVDFTGSGAAYYTVEPSDSATLEGSITSGQTFQILGQDACNGNDPATATTSGNVSNAGTIQFTHNGGCTGGTAGLVVAASTTLTSSGSIAFSQTGLSGTSATSVPESISGTVDSTGAVTFNPYITTTLTGSFTNDGPATVVVNNVAGGAPATVEVPSGSAFTNATNGSIANNGTVRDDGTFTESGITTGNPIELTNALVDVGTGTSSFEYLPSSSGTLTGGTAVGQTVTLQGQDNCNGNDPVTVTVTGPSTDPGTFQSAGTLALNHVGTCNGGVTTLVAASGTTIVNTGTLESDGTAIGTHILAGDISSGTININGGTTQAYSGATFPDASISNTGSLTVASGATFDVDAGASFSNGPVGTSSLVNDGTFASVGTFIEGAGTTSGNAVLVSGTLQFTETGAANFDEPPNSTLTLIGNMGTNQVLTITGQDACNGNYPTTATAGGGFTNAGTIDLDHQGTCGGGITTLALTAGTLTNTGTINVTSSSPGTFNHTISGSVVNDGTVNVTGGDLNFATINTAWDNEGNFSTGAGTTTSFGAGTSLTFGAGSGNTPATLTNAGTLTTAGTVDQNGGVLDTPTAADAVQVTAGTVDFTGVGAAFYTLQPTHSATLEGTIVSGQTFRILGQDACNGNDPATATTSGTVTNGGTIELSHTGTCGGGIAGLVVASGTTLNSSGSIVFDQASVAATSASTVPESVTGSISSSGTVTVNPNLVVTWSGPGTFTNTGTIVTDANPSGAPATLTLGATTTFVNQAGTVTNNANFITAGVARQVAGTTTGNPIVVTGGPIQLLGSGASSYDVAPTHTVTLDGQTIAAGQTITISGQDECDGNDPATLNASSNLVNNGTIDLDHAGTCGAGSATLQLPAGATLTNNGAIETTGPSGSSVGTQVIAANVSGPGTITINSPLKIDGDFEDSSPSFPIVVNGGPFSITGSLYIANGTDLTINCGTGQTTCTPIGVSSGTLDVGPGSVLTLGPGVTARFQTVVNSGKIVMSPTSVLGGSLDQKSNGILVVGVDATSSPAVSSTVSTGGSDTLAGTLDIVTSGGTAPPVNDAFQIIQYAAETGQFDHIQGELIGSGESYALSYLPAGSINSYGSVELTVENSTAQTSLVASNLAAPTPTTAVPGQNVITSFTVTNVGTADLTSGTWDDSVYLAPVGDSAYSPGDTLLQRVTHTGGVDAGASYTVNVSAPIPAVVPGSYELIAVPDSADLISDSFADGQAVSPAFTAAPIPALTPGTAVQATVPNDGDAYYQVVVASGTDVRITSSSATVSLYASNGKIPSPGQFDVQNLTGQTVITLPGSNPGTWFIDVHGGDSSGAAPVTIDPELPGFDVTAVTPNSAGNQGTATITLQGSDMTSAMTVELVPASGPAITASPVSLRDSTVAFATFDLDGATAATYTLKAVQNSQTVTGGTFTVTAAAPATLQVTSVVPSSLRYGWAGTVAVTVTNPGGSDIAVPIIRLSGTLANVALPGSNDFSSSVDLVAPDFSNPSTGPLPDGILPPGQTATFNFSMLSNSTVAHVSLETAAATVDSTETTSVDWNSQLASSQPTQYSAAAWASIIHDVATNMGTTEGVYAGNLLAAIQQARAEGVTINNEQDALNYVLRRQEAGYGATSASAHGVLQLAGQPLSGAAVTLTLNNAGPGTPGSADVYSGTSFGTGNFAFWGVPAGTYQLAVPGYLLAVPVTVTIPANGGTTIGTVAVTTGATMTGTVTAAGAPLAGAVITAIDSSGRRYHSDPSGSDGAYSLAGLPDGTLTVSATGPGYQPSAAAPVAVSASAPTAYDIVLTAGTSISGIITASDGTSAPPSGTIVLASSDDDSTDAVYGTVNPDGTFTITGLAPEAGPSPQTYTVTAVAAGTGTVSRSGIVATVSTPATGVSLTLAGLGSLTGRVTDIESGQPLSGVTVYSDARGAPEAATTDSNGDYTMANVPSGSQTVLFSPNDGTHLPDSQVVTVAAGATATTLNATLAGVGDMTTTLVDGSSHPLTGVGVTLVGPSPTGTGVYTQTLASDNSGTVSVVGLIQGQYDLQVIGSSVHRQFTVDDSHTDITLNLPVPVAVVSGIVSAAGQPVGGLTVTAQDATGQIATTTTTSTGAYSFELTKSGTYDVIAAGPDFGIDIVSRAVTLGTPVTLNLAPGPGSVAATITAGGNPIPGADVYVTPAATRDLPAGAGRHHHRRRSGAWYLPRHRLRSRLRRRRHRRRGRHRAHAGEPGPGRAG